MVRHIVGGIETVGVIVAKIDVIIVRVDTSGRTRARGGGGEEVKIWRYFCSPFFGMWLRHFCSPLLGMWYRREFAVEVLVFARNQRKGGS